jgi:hypothetical protein
MKTVRVKKEKAPLSWSQKIEKDLASIQRMLKQIDRDRKKNEQARIERSKAKR